VQVSAALCALQQYSRSRLPGTTTFKPADPCNMTAVQPSRGPQADTTYGFANSLVDKYNAAAAPVPRAGISEDQGIMGFFSAGASVSISDNGRADAQQYASSAACRPPHWRKHAWCSCMHGALHARRSACVAHWPALSIPGGTLHA
jgi:hypothetical protein